MLRTYKYKVKRMPREVEENAERQLILAGQLYNNCLEQRITLWKNHGVSITGAEQMKQLTEAKKEPDLQDYKSMGSQVLQDVIQRLDRAYDSFFRRVKAGETPGHPRFQSIKRYSSITFKQTGWKFITKNRIWLQGIGSIKFFNSREFPEGSRIKTITLKRASTQDWFLCFALDDVKPKVEKKTGEVIALDLGLLDYYTDNHGTSIPNPRHLRKSEKNLKLEQQKLSQKKIGSKNREKQRIRVAKAHKKVKNSRKDHQHKLARQLVRDYDLIILEDLKIGKMIQDQSGLNKSIHDAAWGQFKQLLISKAEEAGKEVRLINPKNTSQMCSNCGDLPKVRKTLSERTHKCSACGYETSRDHNAAKNILARGQEQSSKSSKDLNVLLGGKRPMRTSGVKPRGKQESPVL